LRYRFTNRAGEAVSVVGKLFTGAEGARDLFDRLARLQPLLAAAGTSVPRAFALLPEVPMVLMQDLPGRLLSDVLLRRGTVLERCVLSAARALAALHAVAPEATSKSLRSLESEYESSLERIERLGRVAPSLAKRASVLARRLEKLDRTAPPELVLAHRDFRARQTILTRGRLSIVDLDSAAAGDAAADVGQFIADLRLTARLWDRPDLRRLAAVFVDEYVAASGRRWVHGRAQGYGALTLLGEVTSFRDGLIKQRSRRSAFDWRNAEKLLVEVDDWCDEIGL
jgi:aminoglycoside/choline kinase family phosphotransferase